MMNVPQFSVRIYTLLRAVAGAVIYLAVLMGGAACTPSIAQVTPLGPATTLATSLPETPRTNLTAVAAVQAAKPTKVSTATATAVPIPTALAAVSPTYVTRVTATANATQSPNASAAIDAEEELQKAIENWKEGNIQVKNKFVIEGNPVRLGLVDMANIEKIKKDWSQLELGVVVATETIADDKGDVHGIVYLGFGNESRFVVPIDVGGITLLV
jgi:hypothetical protein